MTARRAKQFIYGIVYLFVILAVGIGIYNVFFKVAPSCFDNTQNQGEAGIDCGGPCAAICTTRAEDITIGDFQTFIADDGSRTFLARIENHNADFAARSFGYAFDLYDASGTVLRSYPFGSFIYSSEVKYLVLPNVANGISYDHAGLVIQQPVWGASSSLGLPPKFGNPLPITGSVLTSTTITVNGQLADNDVSAFGPVYLVAIFYGANNAAVGASQAQIDAISPGQTVPFAVSYPVSSSTDINPAFTKVYAYAIRP